MEGLKDGHQPPAGSGSKHLGRESKQEGLGRHEGEGEGEGKGEGAVSVKNLPSGVLHRLG